MSLVLAVPLALAALAGVLFPQALRLLVGVLAALLGGGGAVAPLLLVAALLAVADP